MASLSHMESFMSFPPGFKFCPTDEELIYFYLRKKVNKEKLPTNPIVEVNIYLYNPEHLAETYKEFEGYNGWYFFTPRDRKYPNGKRPNRSANNGYWKATGADKKVRHGDQIIGYKKTLVFYHGKPPKGTKTDWIMHEYTLKEPIRTRTSPSDMKLDEWVVCKIYERKKRLEDAEDNDQNTLSQVPQLSTLSQYPPLPHQALQLPTPVLQPLPQPVAYPPLHMDAHEVNTYSVDQLSPWNNSQPVLSSPPPQQTPPQPSQPIQMVDYPPQDALEVDMYSVGQLSPWNNSQPVLPSPPLQQTPPPFSQPIQMVDSPPQDALEVNMYSVGQLSPWTNPQPMLLPHLPLSQAPQQTDPLPLSQPTQMVDSPSQDAQEVNMYIARPHSPWNNPQPVLLHPPAVSQASQYTPPSLSPAPYNTFLLDNETFPLDDHQFIPWDNTMPLYDNQFFLWGNTMPPTGEILDDDSLNRSNVLPKERGKEEKKAA